MKSWAGSAASSGPGAGEQRQAPFRRQPIRRDELEQFISGPQTDNNFLGRQRVTEGILVPTAKGDACCEIIPTDDLGFFILDDVISEAECAAFCEAFRSAIGSTSKHSDHPFWDKRIVFAHELIFNHLPLALRMKELCRHAADLIGNFYSLQDPIYADAAQLVCWPEGMHMDPHADNAYANGAPHGMPWRRFSSIINLNDDYEGGELYITTLNKIVRPRRGRLIAITCGFHHEHAVLKIKKGTRYTMPIFFTNDEDRANEFLYS